MFMQEGRLTYPVSWAASRSVIATRTVRVSLIEGLLGMKDLDHERD